jgi:hypothetical protein
MLVSAINRSLTRALQYTVKVLVRLNICGNRFLAVSLCMQLVGDARGRHECVLLFHHCTVCSASVRSKITTLTHRRHHSL